MSELVCSSGRRAVMTLVQLKEGVYATGDRVIEGHPEPPRVTHIVPGDYVELERLARDYPLRRILSCCGAAFAPGTLEEVAWGTVHPHKLCVMKAHVQASYVERLCRAAEDHTLDTMADPIERAAAVALLEKVLDQRGVDWIQDDGHKGDWEYTASFNGVFEGDARYPREQDLGLEMLSVRVVGAERVHINSCGVRDGCSKHVQRTETFSLKTLDVDAFERRIASHEVNATSIQLGELSWCMFIGDCAKLAVRDANL